MTPGDAYTRQLESHWALDMYGIEYIALLGKFEYCVPLNTNILLHRKRLGTNLDEKSTNCVGLRRQFDRQNQAFEHYIY